jgi:hypothetical protein
MHIGGNAQQWAQDRFTQERYGREVLGLLSEIAPGFPAATSSSSPLREIVQIVPEEGTQPDTSAARLSAAKKMAS